MTPPLMNRVIYILPIGEIEGIITEKIKIEVALTFGLPVAILPNTRNPTYAFEPQRSQYYSTKILKELVSKLPPEGVRVLGITEVDLCTPVFTFVFGEAQLNGKACVVSLARLRQEYYHLPSNKSVLLARVVKEAIHELGHTFGLTHCLLGECVMAFSSTVFGIDQKGSQFCPTCQKVLGERLECLKKRDEY